MSWIEILISAVTAFLITAGGSVGIALVATKGALDKSTVLLAIVLGAVSAAKDTRSLLKLPPPPNGDPQTPQTPKT